MPGIIPPFGGGIPTAASVSNTLRGKTAEGYGRGGDKNNIPDGIEKLKPATRVKFLIGLGYDLNEKDGWGAKAQAAWKNMMSARKRDIAPDKAASYWSSHSGYSTTYKAPAKPDAAPVAPAKPDVTPVAPAKPKPRPAASTKGAGGAGLPVNFGDSGTAAALTALLKQAQKLANKQVAPTLTPSILDQYLNDQDPLASAEQSANLAYDAQIRALQNQMSRLSEDSTAGIFTDLDKYWGMVNTENQNAKKSNQDLLAKNTAELQAATQGFMGAAGGAAEPATANIAAQGVINDADLRAQAAAENSFEGNIGNFFSQAGASQKAQIAGEIAQQRADLAAQLSSLMGEKGMYQSQAYRDLSDQNAQLMLDLNNDLYSQRKDASDTAFNRLLGISNMVGQAALVPQQITQGNISTAQGVEDWKRSIILNAQERERLKQFKANQASQGGEQFPFSQLDPGTRAKLASQLQQNLLGPMGKLTVNPGQFLSTLRNRLYNTAGYDRTPQTEQYIMSLLTPSLISWWNKYHPKHAYKG